MTQQSLTLRGGVRGFSMWPNLIPGDILEAELLKAHLLRPGMIAVFTVQGVTEKKVHRVLSVRNFRDLSVVVTAGDRSGRDSENMFLKSAEEIPRITGVLRRGKYRKVGSAVVPEVLSPLFVVRNHCRIVRRLLW